MPVRPLIVVLLLMSSLLFTACTTQRSSLRSATSYQARTPEKDFAFDFVGGIAKVKSRIVLRAGSYEPAGQDDSGVWYFGKPNSLMFIYVDSPKDRVDGKLATMVYDGGVFVPHDKTKPARMFYVPASEKAWITDPATLGPLDIDNRTSSAFVDQVVIQNTINSPSPVHAALGGAIGGAIIAYDFQGFKIHPVVPPQTPTSLRTWLQLSK